MEHIKNRSVISTALLAFSLFCTAHANTIADWGFQKYYQTNSVTGTNSSALQPDSGPPGSLAWGHHASASSAFSTVAGNGSSNALTANHWGFGDYFEFETSTMGFTNILVSFDQCRSDSGPTNWDFEYSVNGSLFTSALAYSVTNSPAWSASTYRPAYTFSVVLAAITELSESENVYFRLVANSTPGSVLGASRVDNFSVFGTPAPAPEPSTFVLIGAGACLLLFARRRGR